MRHLKKVDLTETGELGAFLPRLQNEWMLVTAGTPGNLNTMTASWGGVGVLWHKYTATIFVRPERHTYSFVEENDYFSVAFFSPAYKKALALCGSKSGREIDKVTECGFTVQAGATGGAYFEEADLVLICRKRYRDELKAACMVDLDPSGFYGGDHGGFHTMYIGEITEVYMREPASR